LRTPSRRSRRIAHSLTAWARLLFAAGLFATTSSVHADALSAVQTLRLGGCGGIVPAARPLQHEVSLDHVAEQWAAGMPLSTAATRSGIGAQSISGVHVAASEASLLQLLRQSHCEAVSGPQLREIGAYRRGVDHWVVLSAPSLPSGAPSSPPAPQLQRSAPPRSPTLRATAPVEVSRALQLVNAARAHGSRCGRRTFGPAPPLSLSATLGDVALGHASDMARNGYFDHQDLSGRSPADRVRAVGYQEKLVGENIAYGQMTVEEVVQGWLDSPDHCENIMDPRFAEMGIAYADGRSSRRGLYWVQLFAAPRG
jgi:uncharacterized protein YkwD